MAKDYTVRFTGEDNVSDTIAKIKEGLKGIGEQTSQIDKITQRFDRISKSSAPFKKQLRELNSLMAQMNLEGLSDSDVFIRAAQRAGELKDAIDDAAQSAKVFSSDTSNLDAVMSGISGIAGAATVATGAMSLFGVENDNVEKALLKVQSVMSILTGVQSVANTLNANSALVLKVKQIATLASAASTNAATVATGANSAGMVANTTATTANTAATVALNWAKAISKALFGDFSGLLIVGSAALLGYAGYTAMATDEEEKNAEAIKNSNEALEKYQSTLASTYANLMTTYTVLRNEWDKLSTEHQKTQWIEQNKTKFEELGVSVNNAVDAEHIFSGNTNTVVQNIIKRAKAAAMLAQLTEEYRKQMELTDKITNADDAAKQRHTKKVKAGDIVDNETKKHLGAEDIYYNYGSPIARFTEKGATKTNSFTWLDNSKDIKKARKELAESQNRSDKLVKDLATQTEVSLKPSTTKSTSTHKPTKTPPKENKKEVIPTDSLKYYKEQLSELEKLRDITPITDTAKLSDVVANISKVKAKIEETEIQLGITTKEEDKKALVDGSIVAFEEAISKIEDRLNNENLDLNTRIILEDEKNTIQHKIDTITKGEVSIKAIVEPVRITKGSIEDRRASYDNFNNRTTQISEDYTKGIISKSEMKAQYEALAKEIADSGINIKFNSDFSAVQTELSRFKNDADAIFDGVGAVDNVVSSMSTLGASIRDGASAWEAFMNAVSMTSTVLEAVNTVMTILNATKVASASVDTATTNVMVANSSAKIAANSGEAISGAVASGAKMPFPINLIAIAGGLAAVMSGLKMVGAFADGGIIGGNSFHGDSLFAKVNAGEMILNKNQQSNLFSMLNNGGSSSVGNVQFKIAGKELVGVLNNYNAKMSKTR